MENLGQQIAEYLLQIKAIKLNPANPFTWASGIKSPIYCDNRKILSHPKLRNFVRDAFVEVIHDKFPDTEVIAGVATGAIALGVLVAEKMDLSFIYVRSSAKGHGLQNAIEGDFDSSKKVLVIEDLVSTGKSSLAAVRTLRQAGAEVLGMVAIFSYLLDVSTENFQKENCRLETLSDYNKLIEMAIAMNYIQQGQLNTLREWRENPNNWQKKVPKVN